MLKNLDFSDIILLDGKTAYLKGTPDKGQQLVPVPENYAAYLKSLFAEVDTRFKDGQHDVSIRISHDNIYYRAACYKDVSGNVYFLRRIPGSVPDFFSIGLPQHLANYYAAPEQQRGLILIAGAQGSGKTTTAAALVKTRLSLYGGHAITFESPVEMPLAGAYGEAGYCFQTEIRNESELAAQIERSHRYSSPNLIYIGEIRSKYAASESLRVALGSNQQLVIATIHGLNAIAALDRLLIWAKELDGNIAGRNLSQTLTGLLQLDLIQKNDKRILNVAEFLMVPFTAEAKPLRAKLKDENFSSLESEICAQQNRMRTLGRSAV
jgi:twitching motility protein PilT